MRYNDVSLRVLPHREARDPDYGWEDAHMAVDGTNSSDSSSSAQSSSSLSDALSREQTSASVTREQEIRSELANNPQAVQALDKLASNLSCYNMTEEQKVQALNDFMTAPNAATAAYVEGRVAQDLGVNLSASHSLMSPDAGTLTMDGQTYSIDQGSLVNAQGQVVGTISNNGTVQFNGEEQTRSVYDDINARVELREQLGVNMQTVLDLRPADSRNRLGDPNLNQDFTNRVKDVIEQARREGMSLRVDTGFRTFAEQNQLYAQGRTAPGNVVTNARGGQSWHNYGLGVDLSFGNRPGADAWAADNNWSRYGEIAADNGLTWGGNWRSPDRPHVEYHPGFGAGDAGGMAGTHNRDGLEGVWDRMGIGQQ